MRLLLIGIVFIIGGASGGMVLRGTGSGLALAALGVIMCLWGGVQMMTSKSGRVAPRRSALNRRPVAGRAAKPPGIRRK